MSDIHDSNLLIPKQDLAALSRLAISKLLSQTGLSCEGLKVVPNESVVQHARSIIESWDIGEVNARVLGVAIEASIGIGTITYAHTSHDAQVYVSLFTFLAMIIDDFTCPSEALHAFSTRMRTGTPQMHPLLDRFVEVLDGASTHYPALAAREIIRGALLFIDCSAVECEHIDVPLRKGSFEYVVAKRRANGMGRVFSCFTWDKDSFPDLFGYVQAIPDLEVYIDNTNDILSFYKEQLACEKDNFISERGIVTDRGIAGALLDTVDEAVASVKNIRTVLEGTKELQACEAAMEGYVIWHRFEKRYKLAEVFGDN